MVPIEQGHEIGLENFPALCSFNEGATSTATCQTRKHFVFDPDIVSHRRGAILSSNPIKWFIHGSPVLSKERDTQSDLKNLPDLLSYNEGATSPANTY